jgi:hypothetical protein
VVYPCPYTIPADLAFAFFLGSVVDVIFNANPLIKLDGYYFLSQWLQIPNLMDRSRAWWRGELRRLFVGEAGKTTLDYTRRERSILAGFGLASFVYTMGLRVFIVLYAGSYLIDWFQLPGLFLTAGLALFYARQSVIPLVSAAARGASRVSRALFKRLEKVMPNKNESTSAAVNSPAEVHPQASR